MKGVEQTRSMMRNWWHVFTVPATATATYAYRWRIVERCRLDAVIGGCPVSDDDDECPRRCWAATGTVACYLSSRRRRFNWMHLTRQITRPAVLPTDCYPPFLFADQQYSRSITTLPSAGHHCPLTSGDLLWYTECKVTGTVSLLRSGVLRQEKSLQSWSRN